MDTTLAENLAFLESSVLDLKAERNVGPLQNDVYEAIDDLRHLGQRAAVRDTRVNYPLRAKTELVLFQKLRHIVSARAKNDRLRYLPLLDRAEELVRQISQIPIPVDGHLGVLKVIRNRFGFLFDQYEFTVTDEQPSSMRLTNGAVIVELGCATQSSLSFSLSHDDLGHFWIEDLLYLHGDRRYESVPHFMHLNTETDVDDWFQFISDVLRRYGDDLLRDTPGAFDRLAQAQSQRDAEYAARMNAKHGQSPR